MFQLYKLGSDSTSEDIYSSITFSYGHCVGLGIQKVLEGCTRDEIFMAMFLSWDVDLFAENEKQQKSYWLAVLAVQKFIAMRDNGYLQDYELVWYNGKPAVELSFRILLPDRFTYRGHVDAVLQHKVTGAVVVLECKTHSGNTLNPAQFKNSAQAIGYSIVLDVIFPALSAYDVLYLVYRTKDREFEQLRFAKSYLQRALWIQELLLDVESIRMYDTVGVFPMRGESCVGKFNRECQYLQVCTLSTERLAKPEPEIADTIRGTTIPQVYQIELTVADLIHSQLAKEVS